MLGEILVSPLHFYIKHFHLLQIFLVYLNTHITLLFFSLHRASCYHQSLLLTNRCTLYQS